MRTIIIISLIFILVSCSSSKDSFRKYGLEKGIITYSLKIPLKKNPIEQKVYFTNYGSSEYIEYVNNEDFPTFPIFKKDSLEYVYVTDSMTINKERSFDFIYEKLVGKEKSNLFNKDLIILNKADTIINDKNCELIVFKLKQTGQNGKAALWKGIPIWVNSKWEKGLYENINLISLDLKSEIPIEKTKIMDHVETE